MPTFLTPRRQVQYLICRRFAGALYAVRSVGGVGSGGGILWLGIGCAGCDAWLLSDGCLDTVAEPECSQRDHHHHGLGKRVRPGGMRERMLEQKAVLVDLSTEKAEQLLRGDDVVGERRVDVVDAVVVDAVVVEIPLAPLLADLVHHGERNSILFSNPVRSPLVVSEVGGCTALAIEIGAFADLLTKGSPPALLLQRADVARIQRQVLHCLVVEDVHFGIVERRLDVCVELRIHQSVHVLLSLWQGGQRLAHRVPRGGPGVGSHPGHLNVACTR